MNDQYAQFLAQRGGVRAPVNYGAIQAPRVHAIPPPVAPNPVYDDDDEEEEEDDENENQPGPLVIHIKAPVSITGNNNLCAIDTAVYSQRVSQSIARAIRELGGQEGNGGAGIPMIDGRGMPRKIDVQVDISTQIEGEGNIIGEKAVAEKLGVNLGRGARIAQEEQIIVNGVNLDNRNPNDGRAAAPPAENVIKPEPVDEVIILDRPPNPINAVNGPNETANAPIGNSSNAILGDAQVPQVVDTVAAPKPNAARAGTKRKSARIAHDMEVNSDTGLGIRTGDDDDERPDPAVKKPRRG